MEAKYLFIAFVFIVVSCNSNDKQKAGSNEPVPSEVNKKEETIAGKEKKDQPNNFWEKMQMNELRDANGTVTALNAASCFMEMGAVWQQWGALYYRA